MGRGGGRHKGVGPLHEKDVMAGHAKIEEVIEVENEKEESRKRSRALADKLHAGRAKAALSGKHPDAGARLDGLRGRTRKSKDAERVSEKSEEYASTTRFVESTLGIKSYSELAPHLAKGVERVMALLLNKRTAELLITPEFVRALHQDAFGELFPTWAGQYRDRNVTVGKHAPPPYYEVPALIRQFCEDLEARLSALGAAPPITNYLLEALAFAEGRFLSIHPFLDFNGRVARMLLFALCYRLDLPPVALVPSEEQRERYLAALAEGDRLNWHLLTAIWKRRLGVQS
jgi:CRISPR-associated endonuclease/helicase Cas3